MLILKSALKRDQGRLVESKQLAEDALKMSRPLGLRSQVAGVLLTLGRTESELGGGNLPASEQHLREALAIWRDMGLRAHTVTPSIVRFDVRDGWVGTIRLAPTWKKSEL